MCHLPTGWEVLHRRSHRHPAPSSSGFSSSGPKSFRAAPAFQRYRDRSSFNGFRSCASRSGRGLSLPQSVTGCPALTADQQSRSSQTTKLASGRNLSHVRSQRPRGQYPPYRVFKKSFVNSDPWIWIWTTLPFPSDTQRLRLKGESFKSDKPEFSTFPQISCGGEWIS